MSKSLSQGQSLVNVQRASQQSSLSASAFTCEVQVFEMDLLLDSTMLAGLIVRV